MATTGERKAGPTRVRRTVKKTALVEAPVAVEEEEVVGLGETAATPTYSARARIKKVRSSDITLFLRQLIMLIESGMPILRSLQTLAKRGRRQAIRDLVADIALFVEGGNHLWQAFDRHHQYFDPIFVNLIKASEASGTLTTVLQRLTKYREERALLAKRVRGASVYPIILLVACMAVMLFIAYVVVPEFEKMFSNAGIEIPAGTQFFFGICHLVQGWWWTVPVAILLLIPAYIWFVRNPNRRLLAHRIKLRIPIVGPIIQDNAVAELTRTLALLLRSGLSVLPTLDLTRNAVHNQAVAQCLQSVRSSIELGGNWEAPLRQCAPVIPHEVTDMIATGEESGRVDVIADQIADVKEEEVKIAVSTIGEAIQPIFTILVGVMVIILFAALFLPMVSMMEQLGAGGV